MEKTAPRHWLLRAQDLLAATCLWVSSLAMVVLVVTFGWLVFGRYVLNVTPTWVEQLALLLICYITFLGAGVGIHERSHLGVTLFRDRMPRPLRNIVLLFTDFVLCVFGIVMLISSIELFNFGWSTLLPMLNIPESFRTLSAVLCGGLIAVFSGLRVYMRLSDMLFGSTFLLAEDEED